MRRWDFSRNESRRRSRSFLTLAFVLLTTLTITTPRAEAAGRADPNDGVCTIVAHEPWTYKNASGNEFVKSRAVTRCDRVVAKIATTAELWKAPVNNAENIQFLTKITTYCNNDKTCPAVVQYDYDENSLPKYWWCNGISTVTDYDGSIDFDEHLSQALVAP